MSNATYPQYVIRSPPYGWELIDPSSTPKHFPFEEIMDHDKMEIMMRSNWKVSIYMGVAYVLAIFGIKWWMRDRPAFQLKWPLFWWNFGLGLFSIVGLSRTLPSFLSVLSKENGFYDSICAKRYMDVASATWIIVFVLSKFVELGDTIFIVLTKRPLKFLQWYHHVVTLNAAWIVAPDMEPVTRWYTVLNFGVHSLMYPYFALRVLGKYVPSRVASLITTLQFVQMIAAFVINTLSMYYRLSGYDCVRYSNSIQIFGVVYGSFIFLFGKLFYDSVVKGGRKVRGKDGQDKKLE